MIRRCEPAVPVHHAANLCRMVFVEGFPQFDESLLRALVRWRQTRRIFLLLESFRVLHRVFDVCGRSQELHLPREGWLDCIIVQTVHVLLSQVLNETLYSVQSAPQERIPQRIDEQISDVFVSQVDEQALESWRSFHRTAVRDVLPNRSSMFQRIRL